MATQCLYKNFSVDDENFELTIEEGLIESPSIVDNIINQYKIKYATSLENSQNPDEYSDSINLFKQYILKVLQDKGVKDERAENIANSVYLELAQSFQTDNSKEDPTVDLTGSNNNKEERTLDKDLRLFFKNNEVLRNRLKSEFRQSLYLRTILHLDTDINKCIGIRNVEDLNVGITNYLNELYSIVYNYMKDNKISRSHPNTNTLYSDSNKERPKAVQNLTDFFNYVKSLDNIETILSLLESTRDHELLDAVNAYLIIKYFNNLILSEAGKNFIYINKDLPSPISEINGEKQYKYSLFGRNSNQSLGWWDQDNRDGIKEMSSYTNLIISQIPILNSLEYLNKLNYILSFLKLCYTLEKIPNGLYPEIENLDLSEGTEAWKKVLDFIFKDKNRTAEKIKNLKSFSAEYNKLNDFDFRIFESVYDYIFRETSSSNHPGIYYVEKYLIYNQKSSPKYGICDTLFSSVNSQTEMNYLEFELTKDNKFVSRIKPKFNLDYRSFELRDALRTFVRSSEDKTVTSKLVRDGDAPNYLKLFGIKISDDITYYVEYADGTLVFSENDPVFRRATDENSEKFTFSNYFKNQLDKTTGVDRIKKLLNSDDLKDREFLKVIDFISKALLIDFYSEDGLLVFNIFKRNNQDGLKTLFKAACKATVAMYYNLLMLQPDVKTNIVTELFELKRYNFDPNRGSYFLKTPNGIYFSGLDLDTINEIAKALLEFQGDLNPSVIKNNERKNIPNVSVKFTDIWQELKRLDKTGAATKNLLFVNPKMRKSVKSTVIDLEVRIRDKSKSISDFSTSELYLYNFLKFIYNPDKYYSLPVTYSDKKKFILFEVTLRDIFGEDKQNIFKITSDDYISKIYSTIGEYYKNIFKKVCNDYRKIFGFSNNETDLDVYKKANNELKKLTLDLFTKKAWKSGIKDLFEDLHYRKWGKKALSANESLLYYVTEIFDSKSSLKSFLDRAKISYINCLAESFFCVKTNDYITKLFSTTERKTWIFNEHLVLARYQLEGDSKWHNIVVGNKIPSNAVKVELNPIIESLFYMHNLIDNNLKLSLVGHELHHPFKKLSDRYGELFSNDDSGENLIDKMSSSDPVVKKLASELVEVSISSTQNTLFKRTVAIPGTINLYSQNNWRGIASTYNVSVIQDVQSPVYDFSGKIGFEKEKTTDSHDGSIIIDPWTSKLENNSLGPSEVGPVKKPLWDIDKPDLGVRELVKCASNTLSNRIMRISLNGLENGLIDMHRMFKKMTDSIKWGDDIDLLNWDIIGFNSETGGISEDIFKKYILENEDLFYAEGDKLYKIINFGKTDDGTYFTEEKEVDSNGEEGVESIKVYHKFDATTGDHIKYRNIEPIPNQNEENINSLFRLHSVMGGIFSMSRENGRIVFSEKSNDAVANFMIYVSYSTTQESDNDTPIDQQHYSLPLKTKLINVLINLSAIKNGASFVNSSDVYYNDDSLMYSTVSTLKYGILLDSDHEADEAKVTEMSQVISSLDATGLYHDEVTEVYNAIGLHIIQSLSIELDAISSINDKNKLYDLVGKVILNNISDLRGLTQAILFLIKKHFNLSDDHSLDSFKIPFSDPNIYGRILNVVGNIINKKAIKRKYPGLGQVIVPSYNIYQIYEVDGRKLLWDDVLNEALKERYISSEKDPVKYHKDIVNQYLDDKCKNINIYEYSQEGEEIDLSSINPLDHLEVTYITNVGESAKVDVYLSTIRDYYKFKENIISYIEKKANNNVVRILSIDKVTKKGRDLAPTRIDFDYIDVDGSSKHVNLFDTWVYKEIYEAIESGNKEEVKNLRKYIPNLLQGLDRNEYFQKNGSVLTITKLNNKPAEVIMSNPFKSKFGLRGNEELDDILRKGYEFFIKKHRIPDNVMYNFDLALVTESNKDNIYISLNTYDDNDNFTSKYLKWDFSKFNKVAVEGEGKIVNRVYIMNDDYVRLYEIGRDIDVSDEIEYDKKKKEFVFKKDGTVVPKERKVFNDRGRVLEFVLFLSKLRIIPNSGEYNFTKISIDLNQLNRVLLLTQLEKQNPAASNPLMREISDIIHNIFKSDSFLLIEPGYNLKQNSYEQVKKVINNLRRRENYNPLLLNYLNNLSDKIFNQSTKIEGNYHLLNLGNGTILRNFAVEIGMISKDEINSISIKKLQILLKLRKMDNSIPLDEKNKIDEVIRRFDESRIEYWNDKLIEEHAKQKYVSFLKSLYYVSSRIPAQTLLSFMLMECVGFNGSELNLCAVTHFLLFLQGSDLDIDKSYMMGMNFDENGIYLEWSNLFDFSTLETLLASEHLPFPDLGENRRQFTLSEKGEDVSEYFDGIDRSKSEERILAYAKLLKYLNKNPNITSLSGIDEETLDNINKHYKTIIPVNMLGGALQNFITSHILQIILNPGNLEVAYTAVQMENLLDAKSITPKLNFIDQLNLFNPAMIWIMQNLNMQGKLGTGIAANGQKALFMWRYRSQEDLNNGNIEYSTFNLTFKTIGGNSKNITYLPNLINPNNININTLNPIISSDNLGSQYISAATDNAKELILPAINSGIKLMKCHLFLVALGYNPIDIVSFMTSKLVSFIDLITDENIFIDLQISVPKAILFVESILENLDNPTKIKLSGVSAVMKLAFIDRFKETFGENLNIEALKDQIEDFKKLYNCANEFGSFGSCLGINQGVPLTKEELVIWKNKFKKIISTAEELNTKKFSKEFMLQYKDVTSENFDFDRWLEDENYRKLTYEYYDNIKLCLNIFYYLDEIPHFSKMFTGARVLNTIDKRISLKSVIVNQLSKDILEKYPSVNENTIKQTFYAIDELIIGEFIKTKTYTIPINPDWNIIDSSYKLVKARSGELLLSDYISISSFKYIMENYIIPELKLNNKFINNEFVKKLVKTEDKGRPLFKVDINFRLKDTESSIKILYNKIVEGLKELGKEEFSNENHLTYLDLLMLYNLIVNRNNYGSSRMTEIFDDAIKSFDSKTKKSNLLLEYFTWLGEQDSKILNIFSDLVSTFDILMKIAPLVSDIKFIKDKVPVVKKLNDKGLVEYFELQGNNYVKVKLNIFSEENGETENDIINRLVVFNDYGFGTPFIATISYTMLSLENLDLKNLNNESKEVLILSLLIETKQITYLINCD